MNSTDIAFQSYVDGHTEKAAELKRLNNERKRSTSKAAKDATIVESGDVVVGIVNTEGTAIAGLSAGRMAHETQKPACICVPGYGSYNCSIRTLGIIDAVEYIEQSEYVDGGGHNAAAGFSLKKKDLDKFIAELSKFVHDNKVEIETDIPDIEIDLFEIFDLYDNVRELYPYGQNFSEPIFLSKNIEINADMLAYTANGHLRITFPFGKAYYYNPSADEFIGMFDISYSLSYNKWAKEVILVIENMENV